MASERTIIRIAKNLDLAVIVVCQQGNCKARQNMGR